MFISKKLITFASDKNKTSKKDMLTIIGTALIVVIFAIMAMVNGVAVTWEENKDHFGMIMFMYVMFDILTRV